MRKYFFLFVLTYCVVGLSANAFKLETSPSDSIIPERTIERDESGITVSYTFPGALMVPDDLYPGRTRLDIPGFGHNTTLEEPEWPVRNDSFEIPEGYEATISIVSTDWCELDISLSPSRPALIDSSNEVYSLDNVPAIKQFSGTLPDSPASISDLQIYRDRNILYVSVYPVKCINTSKTMACEKLTYRVNFTPTKQGKNKNIAKVRHEVDEDYMASLFSSVISEDSRERTSANSINTKWKPAPYYLILSVPEYKTSVDEFAEWKRHMGFNTEVVYSSTWDPSSIKEKIKSKYDSIPSLQYVLLIGDALALPPVRHPEGAGSPYAHSSDYTYGCMDGDDDMEQDIIMGRICVSRKMHASYVINKIINYEKNPPISNNFYTDALNAAYFQDNDQNGYEDLRFTRTSEDIRNGLINENYTIKRVYSTNSSKPSYWNNYLFGDGEPLPDELLKPTFKWNGNWSDIRTSINEGSFYILHRGHGTYCGWVSPCFDTGSAQLLTNGSLLPVCFSINCQSGAFSNTEVVKDTYNHTYEWIDTSFSEVLLRNSEGGAVGIIAASEVSYSGPNDALAMEMFQSIWPKSTILTKFPNYSPITTLPTPTPVYAIGKILQKGMSGLSERYSDKSYIPYTKRIFHCFGDPSMQMYTEKPRVAAISFNNPLQDNSFVITTNETVQTNLVLKNGSVLVANGKQFNITLDQNEIKYIVISGHNLIPFIYDQTALLNMSERASGIVNIEVNHDSIEIEYDSNEGSSDLVRVKSLNGLYNSVKEFKADGGSLSISTIDFENGLYVIELIENGIVVDSRKVGI